VIDAIRAGGIPGARGRSTDNIFEKYHGMPKELFLQMVRWAAMP
jgi:hypothetical protein